MAHCQLQAVRLLMDRMCRVATSRSRAHIVRSVSAKKPAENMHVSQPGDAASQGANGHIDSSISVDRKRDKLSLESTVIFKAINIMLCDIFDAAQSGDTARVKWYIEQGIPVNLKDKNGRTLLCCAASEGKLEVVEYLVSAGCHVDSIDYNILILRKRHMLSSESTVIFKAINAMLCDIFDAAQSGDTARLKWYIEQGIPVNLKDKDSRTLLHCAASEGQLEVVEYLVNAGCRIDPIDYNGWTPLICASAHGHDKVKHFLEQAREPKELKLVIGNELEGIVFSIIRRNDIYRMREFLDCGGSVNFSCDQRSLLNWASEFGHIEIMKLLLERGAHVNARDSTQQGRTPLHRAAASGHVEAIKLLIEKGGDVYSFDNTWSTPFIRALGNERHAAMKELAKYGVNIVDERGLTPLHRATINGGLKDAIVTLLKLGGKDSMTVVAGEQGTPLHQAVAEGSKDIVSLLLNEGCPLDLTDPRGVNPLHVAAEYGYTSIVKLLLQRGCPIDLRTSTGTTVLHYAAIQGHTDLIDFFSQQGLDVNIADNVRMTPMHSAIAARRPDSVYKLQIVGGKNFPDAFGINLYEYIFIYENDIWWIRAFCHACGIQCQSDDCILDIISNLSRNNLIDINRILCLAAANGNVDILDAMLQSNYPLDTQRMSKLIQFLSHNVYNGKIDSSLNDLFAWDRHEAINPLHLSMLILKIGDWLGGTQRKYAARLISHPRTKYTIHELFPNGLSPLDVARQFELHDIAGMIERAGGRPGLWADLPKEVQQRSIECLMSLKSLRGGEFRGDLVSAILAMSGHRLVRDDQILCQKPELAQLEELSDIIEKKRKWKRVGRLLNLDEHTLNSLDRRETDIDDAYYSMLKCWLEHGRSVTWKTLLDAIGRFETEKTMDGIRKKIEEICPVLVRTTKSELLVNLCVHYCVDCHPTFEFVCCTVCVCGMFVYVRELNHFL